MMYLQNQGYKEGYEIAKRFRIYYIICKIFIIHQILSILTLKTFPTLKRWTMPVGIAVRRLRRIIYYSKNHSIFGIASNASGEPHLHFSHFCLRKNMKKSLLGHIPKPLVLAIYGKSFTNVK